MHAVHSKLPAAVRYTRHGGLAKSGGHVPHSVLISGARGGQPSRTIVSAGDHAWLVNDPLFQLHQKNGHLVVSPVEPELEQSAGQPSAEVEEAQLDAPEETAAQPEGEATDEAETSGNSDGEPVSEPVAELAESVPSKGTAGTGKSANGKKAK